jgi:hypothetical protein
LNWVFTIHTIVNVMVYHRMTGNAGTSTSIDDRFIL